MKQWLIESKQPLSPPNRRRLGAAVPAPERPRIYHIIHVDRLASVLHDGFLWCDAEMVNRLGTGTVIGMNRIKLRRLNELMLSSHPGLRVGQCVPFYFCPRSVMLYLIWRANDPDLAYRGGEGTIVHLEADLHTTVKWADAAGRRWAFTLSNERSFPWHLVERIGSRSREVAQRVSDALGGQSHRPPVEIRKDWYVHCLRAA